MNLIFGLIISSLVISIQSKPAARNFVGAVDLTLAPGSSGEDVVTACIQKIESLNIFSSDFGLMERIAKYESDFGTNYASKDQSRGIWQISIPIETELQSRATEMTSQIAIINATFGESIIDFGNIDHTIPLHSAVSARLFIELIQSSASPPGGLTNQAEWWATYYNIGGSTSEFNAQLVTYEETKLCPSKKMDLWFLVDGSSSMGTDNFNTILAFISKLTRNFIISPDYLRTGMSVYSSKDAINTISQLSEHNSNLEFETAVNATVYPNGRTFTGSAITDVIVNGFNDAMGARVVEQGIPRVLIVLTDGYTSIEDPVEVPSTNAHIAGITVFAVGVGLGVKTEEINTISNYPSSKYAFIMKEFEDLLTILSHTLSLELCDVPAVTSYDGASSIISSLSSTYHTYIHVPTTGYVTITIDGNSGSGNTAHGYISTYRNPTDVMHISAFTVAPGFTTTLTVTASSPLARSDQLIVLDVTGIEPEAGTVPLYISITPQEGDSLNVDVKATYVSPTSNLATTTTSSTTPYTYPVVTEESWALEWYIILIIAFGVIIGLSLIILITLIILGISRSKKYPDLTNNLVCSLCACLIVNTVT